MCHVIQIFRIGAKKLFYENFNLTKFCIYFHHIFLRHLLAQFSCNVQFRDRNLLHEIGQEATCKVWEVPSILGMLTLKTSLVRVLFFFDLARPILCSTSAFRSFRMPTQSILEMTKKVLHQQKQLQHENQSKLKLVRNGNVFISILFFIMGGVPFLRHWGSEIVQMTSKGPFTRFSLFPPLNL